METKINSGSSYLTIKAQAMGAAVILLCTGCATSPHVDFHQDPLLKEAHLSARESPAEITQKSNSQLLLEGNVLIGKITVQQFKDVSYNTDVNTQVCQEAAKRGGDIVLLTTDRKEHSETRYKSGRCLRSENKTTNVYVPDYEIVCTRSDGTGYCSSRQKGSHIETKIETICKEVEQIPYTVTLVESEGKVYRHDPDMSRKMTGVVLIEAISSGETGRALEMIAQGVVLTDRGREGQTALTEAAAKGNSEVMKQLIRKKLDMNAPGRGGKTALVLAAENGHTDILSLLNSAGVDMKGEQGADALLSAIESNQADSALFLKNKGARLTGSEAVSTLRNAAKSGDAISIKILLDMGADVNGTNAGGYTALMGAAESGHQAAVKLLIARGAAIDARNRDKGYTALIYAAEGGHAEIVKELIAAGADVNARSGAYGKSALQAAGDKTDIIRILKAAGAQR